MLKRICTAYEAKLKELMPAEEYDAFISQVAKALFAEDIMGMADGAFKDLCLDNFEAITGEGDEFLRLMNDIDTSNYFIDDDDDLGDGDF